MKLVLKIFILMFISANFLYGQTNYDKIKNLVRDKEYEKAALLIPKAMNETKRNAMAFVLYGDIYNELDKVDSALIMYKKADEIDGGEAPIMRKLAHAYSENGNIKEALKIINELIEDDDEDVSNYVEKGLIYVKADSFQQGRTVLTKAVGMDRSNPYPIIALGDLYYEKNIFETARKYYEEALKLDENLIDARIKLATAYYRLANAATTQELADELFNLSLKEWNRVGREDPKNAKAFYQQGKIFFQASRYGHSAQAFAKYVDLRPNGYLGRWYLAQDYINIGKCDSALPHLEIVMRNLDSVETKARMDLARCNSKLKNYAEAVNIFDTLKTLKAPFTENDLAYYAQSAFYAKDTLKAFTVFKELFDRDSSRTKLMGWVAFQYLKRKDYDNAIANFRMLINNTKDEEEIKDIPKYYYYIGLCQFNAERPAQAIPPLEKSISLDSAYLKSYLALGDAYAAIDSIDTSKYYFEYVITKGLQDTTEYKSEVEKAYPKLIGLLAKEKDSRLLNKYAKDWTEFDPNSEYAWLVLAISYHRLEDKDNACRAYKQTLKINPKNKTARKNKEILGCE